MQHKHVILFSLLSPHSHPPTLFFEFAKTLKYFAFIRSDAEEAATREDYFYARTARRFGGVVCQNSLPGHIHARRGGAENQSPRVPRAGE